MVDEARYAGFWIRVVASIIDSILVFMIIAPPLYWLYGKAYFEEMFDVSRYMDQLLAGANLGASAVATGPADELITWVLPAIGIIAFWVAREATPGKIWLKLRIVDAKTLGHMGRAQAVIRYLAYYVSIIPFALGLLWVAFDARKQGWHDRIAGTVVIHA